MPYSDEKIVLDEFERLKNKYEYPDDVILNFLDKKYKFRKMAILWLLFRFMKFRLDRLKILFLNNLNTIKIYEKAI